MRLKIMRKIVLICVIMTQIMSMSIQNVKSDCQCVYGIEPRIIVTAPTNNQFYGNSTVIQWQFFENGTSVPINTCVLNFSLQDADGEYLILMNSPLGTSVFLLPTEYEFEIPNGTVENTDFDFTFMLWYNVSYSGNYFTIQSGLDYTIRYLGNSPAVEQLDIWGEYKEYIIGGIIILFGLLAIIIIFSRKKDDGESDMATTMLLASAMGLGKGGVQVPINQTPISQSPISQGIPKSSVSNELLLKGFPTQCDNLDLLLDTKTPQGIFCRKKYKEMTGKFPEEKSADSTFSVFPSKLEKKEIGKKVEKKPEDILQSVPKPETENI